MIKAKIAIDANVFIYVLEQHIEFCQSSLNLIKLVETGDLEGVASELILLEVLSDKKLQDSQVNTTKDFLYSTLVTFRAVTQDVLLSAAVLRRQNPSLKTPDAIHLASALIAGASHFITNDQKLLQKKIKGIQLLPLAKAATLFN